MLPGSVHGLPELPVRVDLPALHPHTRVIHRACQRLPVESRTVVAAGALVPPGTVTLLLSRPTLRMLPQVESRTVVAAGALVPPGTVIPSGQVWAGSPAKFIRNLVEGENALRMRGLCISLWHTAGPLPAG